MVRAKAFEINEKPSPTPFRRELSIDFQASLFSDGLDFWISLRQQATMGRF
jgi:hypothetical protein